MVNHEIIAGSDIAIFVFPTPEVVSLFVGHNYGASIVTFDELEKEFCDVEKDVKIKYAEKFEQMASNLRKAVKDE